METFEQACTEIARVLGISQSHHNKEDIRHEVVQRLSAKTTGRWLLVVDNVDDLDMLYEKEQEQGLLEFLPESDLGLTLFTTRYYEVAQCVAGSDVVEVAKMQTQEAIDLFHKLLQRTPLHHDAPIKDLLSELDCLPLAITQAAAYINSNRSSISDYLRLLKKTEQDAVTLMSTEFRDNTRYRNSINAVAKTWMISFNQIHKHNEVAAGLLAFISQIEWKAIPYSILPAAEPEAQMAGAIGTLCSYSFLERRQHGEMFDMHRLVYLATRIWIRQNGREAKTRKVALKHLSKVFPSDDYKDRKIWQSYMPHVARIYAAGQSEDTKANSDLCLGIGRCLYRDGRMREAIIWVRKSYEWGCRNLDEADVDRLLSQHVLAKAYRENGQVKEAIKLLESVVAISMEVLGESHSDQLSSQRELAKSYYANGQVKETIKLLESVIAIEAGVVEEHHPNRLSSLHGLAMAYHANGQIKEAIKLLELIVTTEAKAVAHDDPNRLWSQHELARAYLKDGQVKEAIKLMEPVVAIRTEVLPVDHPHRLTSQHQLAVTYYDNGQVEEAIKLLEHVVAIRTEVLAPEHSDRLASQHELAFAYQARGQVEEAVQLLEHVVSIQLETLEDDHPNRIASERLLASFHEELLKKSQSGKTSVSSAKGPKTEDETWRLVPQGVSHNNDSALIAISNLSLTNDRFQK
jgi:tetratricopeptide (TPR) repeat protein